MYPYHKFPGSILSTCLKVVAFTVLTISPVSAGFTHPPVLDSAENAQISIHKGWNLLSGPLENVKKFDGVVVRYKENKYYLNSEDSIQDGEGFWLFSENEGEYQADDSRIRIASDYYLDLQNGWNLLGAPQNISVGDVLSVAGADVLYVYDAENAKYIVLQHGLIPAGAGFLVWADLERSSFSDIVETRWTKPGRGACESQGGVYREGGYYNGFNTSGCFAGHDEAVKICEKMGETLPSVQNLANHIRYCGGVLLTFRDEGDDGYMSTLYHTAVFDENRRLDNQLNAGFHNCIKETGFSEGSYWTEEESSDSKSWRVRLSDGVLLSDYKSYDYQVQCYAGENKE